MVDFFILHPFDFNIKLLYFTLLHMKIRLWYLSTVRIGYSVTASNDLSVIAMESRIIKSKMLPYHTNCIGYSDLGYSDKPGRYNDRKTRGKTHYSV